MSAPTPGPWESAGDGSDAGFIYAGGIPIADFTLIDSLETSVANARLAAAAPEFLAAAIKLEQAEDFHANCEECEGEEVPELCGICFPHFDAARCMRRAALAKAVGAP